MTTSPQRTHWLDRIQVVLVGTSHAGNVGSVARAMKNMGLTRLTLVAPQIAVDEQARATAKHAGDLLDRARICADLETALVDSVAVWATSARPRDVNLPLIDARTAAQAMRQTILSVSTDETACVSILFGAERTGLTNAQLQPASALIEISANPDYPVLNLAQAVQIVSYELQMASRMTSAEAPPASGRAAGTEPPARIEAIGSWLARLDGALVERGFFGTVSADDGADGPDPLARRRLLGRIRLLLNRARPSANELAILHGMLTALTASPDNDRSGGDPPDREER